MNKKEIKTEGQLKIDPRQMDPRDLTDAACMLEATATLLRQSFGIIAMTNELQSSPMSESELKSFANQFDIVHKTCRIFAKETLDFVRQSGRDRADKTGDNPEGVK